MQFVRAVRGIASVCLLSVLVACGGGSDDESPNTLTVVDSGDSSVPAGVYTLDTTYAGVSSTASTSFGTVEFAAPEHPDFDTDLMYVRGATDKYFIAFWDSEGTDNFYSCRSRSWTAAELQELEALVGDNTLSSVPVCRRSATIKSDERRIRFNNLVLHSDRSSGTVTVSGDFTWAAP